MVERVEKGEELGSLVVVMKMRKGIKMVMKEEWPQVQCGRNILSWGVRAMFQVFHSIWISSIV